MQLIRWTERISVGNKIIDYQHKKLIQITNRLIENSNAKADSEMLSGTLSELLEYSRVHFKKEEELLKQKNYPKLQEHINKHNEFKHKMAMFCKDVIDKKENVSEEMTKYLRDWVVEHTSEEDIDYKKYIKD